MAQINEKNPNPNDIKEISGILSSFINNRRTSDSLATAAIFIKRTIFSMIDVKNPRMESKVAAK